MAQHNNEHLTITELSAYLDKELTPAELAQCDAHIQNCQPCQAALADLRLTSALLGSLPQVAVPRSFVLPTNLAILPETPPTTTKTPGRSSALAPIILKRSLRALSTLAAVLGLFFILAAAIPNLPHGSATSGTASSNMSEPQISDSSTRHAMADATATRAASASNTPSQDRTPHAAGTYSSQATAAPDPAPTPASTPTVGIQAITTTAGSSPPPQLPAALNLGLTEGRLTIGGTLLLLGLLGVFMTRLLGRPVRH